MKWTSNDLQKYLQAKEYIDTVIIPVQGFQLQQEKSVEKDAFQREVLSIYSHEIEKELSGRILLTPPYNYIKSEVLDEEVQRLNHWIEHMQAQPFKTIFILTFDNQWKKREKEITGELLWFPSIQTKHIHSEETGKMIRSQVEQVSELIRSYW